MDLISIRDLNKDQIEDIVSLAYKMEEKMGKEPEERSEVVATLFFEPSTRTKLSFQSAASYLGMKYLDFLKETSSLKKGESFSDTIKVVSGYADVIVVRHPMEGAARLAAEVSEKPVINGGDGKNQHPTQTLLDLFSIKKTQGKLNNLKVAMSGDLKYGRTVHSLATALALFGVELYFVAPEILQMPKEVLWELEKKNIKYHILEKLEDVIPEVDILYCTRIQKERFADLQEYERVKNLYVLKKDMLKDAKENLRVMHPLPRVNEIDVSVDNTKYAYYFQQSANGVPTRMAILEYVLNH